MNVKIDYTQEEENVALKMMPCYQTQYTSEELIEDHKKKVNDNNNFIYFRRLSVKEGMQAGF